MMKIETNRLILRQWKREDYPHYTALCADSHVMRFFPSTLSRQQSDAQAESFQRFIADKGWGVWAVELKSTTQFMGFVGLRQHDNAVGYPEVSFTEIMWRLSSLFWGLGYAPEAAQKALQFAFTTLEVASVCAMTVLQNTPSQRVMQKLGMVNTHQDFDHPLLPKAHPLVRHCFYQIASSQWQKKIS